MTKGQQRLRRTVNVLAHFDESRYPRVVAMTLGIMAIGIGLLFLGLPERFDATGPLQYVLLVNPLLWGVLFLSAGVSLVSVCTVAPEKAHAICGALALLMFAFAILAALGVLAGGTGLVGLVTLGFAWLLLTNAITGIAPRAKEWLS